MNNHKHSPVAASEILPPGNPDELQVFPHGLNPDTVAYLGGIPSGELLVSVGPTVAMTMSAQSRETQQDPSTTDQADIERETLREKLNLPVASLLLGTGANEHASQTTAGVLHRQGVETARDVVLLGRARVRSLWRIGDKTVVQLADALQGTLGADFDWKTYPDAAQAAQYYDDSSVLPSYVLDDVPIEPSWRRTNLRQLRQLDLGTLALALPRRVEHSSSGIRKVPDTERASRIRFAIRAYENTFNNAVKLRAKHGK